MKNKKMVKILFVIFGFIIINGICFFSFFYTRSNDIYNVYIDNNNKIVIELKNNYDTECFIGNSLDNPKWVKMRDNKCIFNYVDSRFIYLKNRFNNVFRYDNKKLIKVLDFDVDNKSIYLALGGVEQINYSLDILGKTDELISFKSKDENIVSVDSSGLVIGKNIGTTGILVKYLDKEVKVDVVVTDKIITYSDEFDYNREYLGCNMYSKEDNDLLDTILKNRIERVGYKTRAGVVAAARFIALEFPYRINYFSENGRLHPYGAGAKIDGEGRYYHAGLFLDESRFNVIENSMYGPATWGCSIYSFPSEGMRKNGFDCSGFISWIIYNGGYECEDLGAGVSTIPDMTDLGERVLLKDAIDNKSIKAGDLLSGDYAEGGHIALVAGIKDNNYYVAESLWFGGIDNGAQIRKYTSQELLNNFYWQVDMDKYYIDNGDYNDFWIN